MHYNGETITDDIVKFSSDKNINILDLRPVLYKYKDDKEILYWKTDTHWNEKGASIAYGSIINYINEKYLTNIPIQKYSLKGENRGGGDLSNFLKISTILKNDYEKRFSYIFDTKYDICKGDIDKNSGILEKCVNVENSIMGVGAQPQYMINNAVKENKLLLLCDSFGGAPSQLYNSSFNTIWKWHYGHINGQKLFNFVKKNKPDIVIYQIVERSLYNRKIVTSLLK